MVCVNINKDRIEIKLNSFFYPKEIVKQAIADFNNVCNITEENSKLKIMPLSGKLDPNLGYEFMNYLLGLVLR